MHTKRSRSSISAHPALLTASALIAALCFAVSASAATQTSSTQHLQLVSTSAKLIHKLDSQNAMKGQRVEAELTSKVKTVDSMDLPKGTMLIGKVERVQMSTDHSPAKISVLFNQARLKDGRTIPVKATILAAYPASSWNSYNYTGMGGPMVGMQSHFIPYDQKVVQEPGTLSHVTMRSAVQSRVSAVFSSKDRNIDLRRGTQLQIAVAPQAASMG